MKLIKLRPVHVKIVTGLMLLVFTCQAAHISGRETYPGKGFIAGEWQFSGHIGNYINKISKQRILDKDKWELIYPETEEAFRLREDDRNYPQVGRWRGEFWGKYILSAIAASRYYHSDELKVRVADAVKGLISTQGPNGYIGTYAHSDFVIGNNWNVWNRKYTLWALVEAWELLGDQNILNSTKRFVTHLISEVGPDAASIVKTGNFYGMPSSSILQPMVKLYNATGDKKYLKYAEYVVRQWSDHPDGLPDILNKGLSGVPIHEWFPKNDPIVWAKAYELVSCVEGLAELYEVTGESKYLEAASNIHLALAQWERTPVGSLGFYDKFTGAGGLINTLSEICDAVYWNRLSYKMFKITGEEKYIEEIERTLYNTLLSAYNPEGTWSLRALRMSHIHLPADNHFLYNHHCCTDNLPRGLFQAAEGVLGNRDNKIYLSLYNEGKGRVVLPSGRYAEIDIRGDFLENGGATISLSVDQPENFSFLFRIPRWSRQTRIKINGQEQKGNVADRWMEINRKWKKGDQIDVSFTLSVWWENFDNTKSRDLYHDVVFYQKKWAELKFPGASNEEINRRYTPMTSLSPIDALPHKRAMTYFYGPLALSRDVRITEGDIFSPIRFSPVTDAISIRPVSPPQGIWKEFEISLGQDRSIKFCDFSSAGNTWNLDSEFNTWCILKE